MLIYWKIPPPPQQYLLIPFEGENTFAEGGKINSGKKCICRGISNDLTREIGGGGIIFRGGVQGDMVF